MTEKLNKRLDYLINELKAYEGFNHRGRGLRNAVKSQLYTWNKEQQEMEVVRVPYLFSELWKQSRRKFRDGDQEKTSQPDWHTFPVYPSSNSHLRIEDKHGQLLIYRLRIPQEFTDTLTNTEHLIPKGSMEKHIRGNTSQRYWGLWKKYVREPRMTSDYFKDLPFSQQWLDANQPYFQYMTNVLRLLEPKMYTRYASITQFLPENLKPLCGAWYACGILQGMTEEGAAHKDISDYYCGLNANTSWGDFTSAKLVFWELGLNVEVKKGDAILFLPRVITHNAVDVQGGVRNVVDAFVHQAPLLWKDKMHRELTGYGREGRPGKKQKLGKGKEKEIPAKEEEDEEAYDTEWELGALYMHKGARQAEKEEGSD